MGKSAYVLMQAVSISIHYQTLAADDFKMRLTGFGDITHRKLKAH